MPSSLENRADKIAAAKAVKGKSVKVVPPTSSLARDIKNIKETGKVLGAKEGTTARAAAAIRVRTSGGLGGGGTLRNVIR